MAENLAQEIDYFLAHLVQERRLSKHTVSAYKRDLTQASNFFHQNEIKRWSDIDSHQVRRLLAELKRQGLSSRSIQRMLSSLRSFFKFLVREGIVEQNPAKVVQAPKAEKRLPSTLDVDQLAGLLDTPKAESTIAKRDQAIMELFYSSGLRLSELAALNIQDIDLADSLVYVTGKGNKSRVVPVGNKAVESIKAWLQCRNESVIQDGMALFLSKQGKRLGVRSIQQRLKHWGKQQGVSEHIHPHRLRHAFASHMLEASGDLRAVQELLGHADISTTQVYTHVDFQHLAKVYDDSHPRAKKK